MFHQSFNFLYCVTSCPVHCKSASKCGSSVMISFWRNVICAVELQCGWCSGVSDVWPQVGAVLRLQQDTLAASSSCRRSCRNRLEMDSPWSSLCMWRAAGRCRERQEFSSPHRPSCRKPLFGGIWEEKFLNVKHKVLLLFFWLQSFTCCCDVANSQQLIFTPKPSVLCGDVWPLRWRQSDHCSRMWTTLLIKLSFCWTSDQSIINSIIKSIIRSFS